MNIGNNPNIAMHILVVIVIIMAILGTTSFVLFFTHCPPSCNVVKKKPFNVENFQKNKHHQNQHKHHQSQHKHHQNKYATQLIPIEDIFNDF